MMVIITVTGAFRSSTAGETRGGPNNASQVLGTWLYDRASTRRHGLAAAIGSLICRHHGLRAGATLAERQAEVASFWPAMARAFFGRCFCRWGS
jgi:hypothetical protein